jgi:hypothetical protein
VNDAAEGVIVGAIKERNIDASKYWLSRRHPDFKDQLARAGIVLTDNDEGDTIIEVFAQLKPKTRELLAPYLKKKKPLKTRSHDKK